MTENNENQIVLPPIKLAFVLDGKIVDILNTDERLAAVFLSDPLVLDITGHDRFAAAQVGWLYDEDTDEISPDPNAVVPNASVAPKILGSYLTLSELEEANPSVGENEVYVVQQPQLKMYKYDDESSSWIPF